MIEMYDAGGTGSQMAPQTLEIPQNQLANGAGLARRFGALAGSAFPPPQQYSASFAPSATKAGSAMRPSVEAIRRCWKAIAFSTIRRPASVR